MKNDKSVIRLTAAEIGSIGETFRSHFSPTDHLWIFGSRVNPQKHGGDIDLYIETHLDSLDEIVVKKIRFLVDLKNKIGEQRVDVIIKRVNDHRDLPIYQEAKSTGILLA